jgi:hypothetical protein
MAVLALSMLPPLTAAAPPAPFVFRIPDGWTDLSPGAPAANFEGLPETLAQEVASGRYAAYAVGAALADGGYEATFNAILHRRPVRVTHEFLEGVMQVAVASMARKGVTITVREKRIFPVAGANVGCAVSDYTSAGVNIRQAQYVLPGLERAAILTYATTPEKFERLRPVFEASALATQGIRETTLWARLRHSDRAHYVLGALAGFAVVVTLLAVVVIVLLRR